MFLFILRTGIKLNFHHTEQLLRVESSFQSYMVYNHSIVIFQKVFCIDIR